MDDNEEYDSFSVNDTDLEYALNPDRRRFRQTKEQQTYGIWAENDDYDTRPSFGKRTKNSGFVNFVSGGISIGSKMEEEDEKEKNLPGSSREDAEENVIEIPLVPEKKRRKNPSDGMSKTKSFAGMRGSNSASGVNATWASSKVMNMMKNMGWQHGKGLGQKGQGIVEPVEAVHRPGRAAVGAYGNETKGLKFGESAGTAQRRNEGDDDGEIEEQNIEEARNNAWKKSHAGKIRPKYKTLDEIVKEGNDFDQPKIVKKSTVKFIDMTGPDQKVYDSIHSFQQQSIVQHQSNRKNFNVRSLTENIDHLLLSSKNEIHLNNDQLNDLKNKTAAMERDKIEIEKYVEDASGILDKVAEVTNLVKRFNNPQSSGIDLLDEYLEIFYRIKTNYPAEYHKFDLDCLVEFKVLPLMVKLFTNWNPFNSDNIEHGLNQLRRWREILSSSKGAVFKGRFDSDKASVYDLLLWHAWLPAIQRSSINWDPRTDSNRMIELIGTWVPILPDWIQDTLFDDVIVRKIRERVEDWDPINDEIPIDSWVIPWHEILGDRLLIVYPQIRQKLAKALRMWQATDLTAIAVLRPWKGVFSPSTMHSFLNTNIVPKLRESLQKMNLNPKLNTEYSEFYAVMDWHEMLGTELICDILINSFFQRWYENLCHWLHLPNSVKDVSLYYKEWKDRISPEIAQTRQINAEFVRALMAIKQARDGHPIVPMPSLAEAQVVDVPIIQAPPPPIIPSQSTFIPTSLKQLVEHKARELGIVFAPQPNRYHHGHIVYRFGNKSIYIDGTALFYFELANRDWAPISFEHLISSV